MWDAVSQAYTDFAQVYDIFMDETPYGEWCDFLAGLIGKYGVSRPVQGRKDLGESLEGRDSREALLASERDLVLDLGCGTGTLTELMAGRGYDMIGVDSSEEMLRLAMEKRDKEGHDTLYLLQDMRRLELYSTVGTVISVCDSLNYLLEEDELAETFRRVNNYLYPGGIFLFDFNTVYKYAQVIGDATIAENREDCSFIWENYYHPREQINEYDLTVFVREGDGRFRRFQETHYQRGYTLEQIKSLLERAGLRFLNAWDGDTRGEVTGESQRIYCMAGECGKGR